MAHRQSLQNKLNYLLSSGEKGVGNGEIPVQFYMTASTIPRLLEIHPLFETQTYFLEQYKSAQK